MSSSFLTGFGVSLLVFVFAVVLHSRIVQRGANPVGEEAEKALRLLLDQHTLLYLLLFFLGMDTSLIGVYNPVVGWASVTIDNPLVVVMAFVLGYCCVTSFFEWEFADLRNKPADLIQLSMTAAISWGIVIYALFAHFNEHLRGALFQPFIGYCIVAWLLIVACVYKPWQRLITPAASR